jgi:hypothetical protein
MSFCAKCWNASRTATRYRSSPASRPPNTGSGRQHRGHRIGTRRGGGERFTQWIGDRLAGLGLAAQECDPRRHRHRQPLDIAPGVQRRARRVEQPIGQLLRPVPRDLRQQMADLGIAEAIEHRIGIACDIEPLDRRERGGDVLVDQPRHEAFERAVRHRLEHRLMPARQPDIGQGRMRAVEDAQLGLLVAAHVAGQRHAGGGEIGPVGHVEALEHPLREALALDRGAILDTDRALNPGEERGVARRGDRIDHRIGERHFACDPVGQPGILRARQRDARRAELGAVAGHVVAAQHREGRQSRGAAIAQPGDDPADHARRLGGARQIVDDVGMREIELPSPLRQ